MIIVGDISIDEAVQLVGSSLGEWQGRQQAASGSSGQLISREIQAIELVAKPEAAQTELRWQFKKTRST